MRSTSGKVVVVLVALVGAMVLFLILQNDDDNEGEVPITTPAGQAGAPSPQATNLIVVKRGEPVGGVAELEFSKGERIRFSVRSDINEDVHLHGYDVSKPVKGGGRVSFDVPATIDGIFEVELEESAVPIAEVTVNP